MLFGKHINRYYLKHLPALLIGVLSLVVIDFLQLKVPELYRMVINGMNHGVVEYKGETVNIIIGAVPQNNTSSIVPLFYIGKINVAE